jgi:hypothetical protein
VLDLPMLESAFDGSVKTRHFLLPRLRFRTKLVVLKAVGEYCRITAMSASRSDSPNINSSAAP